VLSSRAAVYAQDRAITGPPSILLIMSVERNQFSPQVECSAPVLYRGSRPPRGFRLKTSIMGGQQYWPEVWATPALAPKRSAGASAAAWREQLGDGEAGLERQPRGRAAQVGQADWGVGCEGVSRGWAAVATV
jgi:hypothetical protein